MRSSNVLIAIAGVAVAHEGHATLTVTQSTTITVIACGSVAAGSCTRATVTVPVAETLTPILTPAPSTSAVKVETVLYNTTLIEVPTTAAPPPVATNPAPIYPTANLTVPDISTTTSISTLSEGTGYVTSVAVVTPSGSGATSTPSTPPTPPVGAGARVAIPSVMLGLMALGAAFFA